MSRSKIIVLVAAFAGVLIAFAFFPRPLQNDTQQDTVDTLKVYTSFYPLAYAVSEVGGNRVSVTNLLASGGEAHDFEPSLREYVALGESDLFLYNGAHLEPWVEKWGKGSFERPTSVVDVADLLGKKGVPMIIRDGEIDPHFWLDPMIFKQEVDIIRDALIVIDPIHADEYRANGDRLISTINNLDQRFRDGLRSCANNSIITSHDAFGYLARQYNFSVIPIAGISPHEEPSPKALSMIVDLARTKGLKHVFFETTASPKLSEVIAREIGGQTLVLNPLESLTADELQSGESYISKMDMNLNNLRTALLCN